MGFYKKLDDDKRAQYDSAKEEYDTFKAMLGSANKEERSILRRNMRANKSVMHSIAHERRGTSWVGSHAVKGIKSAGEIKGMSASQVQAGIGGVSTALKMFNAAGQLLDGITGAFGLNTEQVSQSSADRAGFGSANKFTGFINKIPGAKFVTSFGATTLENASDSAYWNTVGSGFTGTRADTNAAKDLGGKRMLFGAEKAKAFIDTSNAQNAAVTRIGMESEIARQNDIGQLYQNQNFNKYQGYSPGLLLSKHGGVLPELILAKDLFRKLTLDRENKENVEITKYQLGGKITANYIPEGALHRNKHHITDSAPELEGQITEKGIPVVSDNDGEIQQHAEIEGNELTLSLPTTKQVEEYYNKYKENPTDELLIECGKYFAHELLQNTEDPGKLIKEL